VLHGEKRIVGGDRGTVMGGRVREFDGSEESGIGIDDQHFEGEDGFGRGRLHERLQGCLGGRPATGEAESTVGAGLVSSAWRVGFGWGEESV
jgi:hypothetical protein